MDKQTQGDLHRSVFRYVTRHRVMYFVSNSHGIDMPPFPAYFDSCGVETLKKEESDQLEIEHVPLSLTGNEVENPQVGMQRYFVH